MDYWTNMDGNMIDFLKSPSGIRRGLFEEMQCNHLPPTTIQKKEEILNLLVGSVLQDDSMIHFIPSYPMYVFHIQMHFLAYYIANHKIKLERLSILIIIHIL